MTKIRWSLVAIVLLAWAPYLVEKASSAVWQWSQTASSNAEADPSINWRTGMAPSQVSPSARAMMAAVAAWRDDISGALQDTGTPTAYQVTTNEDLNNGSGWAPINGQMLAFVPANSNGVGVTLTVDAGNTYPIQSSPGNAIPAGTLIAGTPYTVTFNTTASAWVVRDLYGNPSSIPLGGLMPYTGTTAPNSNFIFPAGQCISTTTYASYWALMGSPASGSCPGGQFAVIDLRGKVPAALDNLNGTAANVLTSSANGCGTAMTSVGAVCANGSESRTLTAAQIPAHTHPITDPGHTHTFTVAAATTGPQPASYAGTGVNYGTGSTGSSTTGITVNANTGGGGAHSIVQPTIGVTYLLRVI